MQGMNKRFDIQALRGVAVISVFLYHFNPRIFPNGYIGVDIFFVISGLLVCSQLSSILGSQKENSPLIDFVRYFLRRLLRILPALSVFLILAMIFIIFFMDSDPNSQNAHLKHSLQSLVSIYNFDLLQHSSDYFQSKDPLLNLWSLSVEVQTYFMLTILAFFVTKIAARESIHQKIFRLLILISGIGSAVFCVTVIKYASYLEKFGLQNLADAPSFINFYSPFSRLWEFSLGGLLGLYCKTGISEIKYRSRLSKNIVIAVIFFLLFQDVTFNSQVRVVLILAFTVLFLSLPDYSEKEYFVDSLNWIGDRSYSIYLYHLIVISLVFLVFEIDNLADYFLLGVGAACLTVVLGNLSFTFIESKFPGPIQMGGRESTSPRKLLLWFFMGGAIAISTISTAGSFLPHENNSSDWTEYFAASKTKACPLGHDIKPCKLVSGHKESWMLVGDSHAGALQVALGNVAKSQEFNLLVWNQCMLFNPGLLGQNSRYFPSWCIDLNANRFEYIRNHQVMSLFIAYQETQPRVGDSVMPLPVYKRLIAESIESIPKQIQVFEFSQVPEYLDSIQSGARVAKSANKTIQVQLLQNFKSISQGRPQRSRVNYTWVDLLPAFCQKDKCTRYRDGWLYVDNNHLSILGANETIPIINSAINRN